MSDLIDILAPNTTGDAQDTCLSLEGVTLHPFSAWRYRLGDALGLRYFRALTLAKLDSQLMADLKGGSYPGVENDCALVLWLCASTKDEIGWAADPFRRAEAIDTMGNWADAREIYPGGRNYGATDRALALIFELDDAFKEGNAAQKNDPKKNDIPAENSVAG